MFRKIIMIASVMLVVTMLVNSVDTGGFDDDSMVSITTTFHHFDSYTGITYEYVLQEDMTASLINYDAPNKLTDSTLRLPEYVMDMNDPDSLPVLVTCLDFQEHDKMGEVRGCEILEIPPGVRIIEPYSIGFSDVKQYRLMGDASSPVQNNFDVDDYGVLYRQGFLELLAYPNGRGETVEHDRVYRIPAATRELSECAFMNAKYLEVLINLPVSMDIIRDRTFYKCRNLKEIYANGSPGIPDKVAYIGDYAFYGCWSLSSINLSPFLKYIGNSAFGWCSSLETITLPPEVSVIEGFAFSHCTKLRSIETEIGSSTYVSLDGVLFKTSNTMEGMQMNELFLYPCGKSAVKYTIPDEVTYVTPYAFYSVQNLEELVFNKMMIEVGMVAVYGCESIKKVTLPPNIRTIGDYAFGACNNLDTIEGGGSVMAIGPSAFTITNLKDVRSLFNSVEFIGDSAFRGCRSLESVVLPSTLEYLGSFVFLECASLKKVEFMGTSTILEDNSLSIGIETQHEIEVVYDKGLEFPYNVANDMTTLMFTERGEHPYPWENFIGVAICLLILALIIMMFREV